MNEIRFREESMPTDSNKSIEVRFSYHDLTDLCGVLQGVAKNKPLSELAPDFCRDLREQLKKYIKMQV